MRSRSYIWGLSLLLAAIPAGATPVPAQADPITSVPATRVNAHKFKANLSQVKAFAASTPYKLAPVAKASVQNLRLNPQKLEPALKEAFKNEKGYAFQLRKDGNVVLSQSFQDARTVEDGNKRYTIDTRMHIASLSKLITTIAAVKALTDRGLSFDQKIGAYLPAYWHASQNVGNITFRRLLTHTSGFIVNPSADDGCGCSGDYQTMKAVVAADVPAQAAPRKYENVNFSIMRVIVPILIGKVSNTNSSTSDAAWDIQTTQMFMEYVHQKVFNPSGVFNISPMPDSSSAFAYRNGSDYRGVDTGDLTTQVGGVGFRISVKEVLNVMDNFRRKGTIVSAARAQEAIEAGLGLDWELETPAGKLWEKNGGWTINNASERTTGFFLPDGYELVLFTNSNGPLQGDVATAVKDAYLQSLDTGRSVAAH